MAFSLTVALRQFDAVSDIMNGPVKSLGKAHNGRKVRVTRVIDPSIKGISVTAAQDPFESHGEALHRRECRRTGFKCTDVAGPIR